MKFQKYLRTLFLYICAVAAVFTIAAPTAVYAQVIEDPSNTPNTNPSINPGTNPSPNSGSNCTSADCERLTKKFVDFINLLSALVGISVIGSIIWGGIEYITAADNAQRISGAKARIRNSLIALMAYFFMYAFLQWLVPGGIL